MSAAGSCTGSAACWPEAPLPLPFCLLLDFFSASLMVGLLFAAGASLASRCLSMTGSSTKLSHMWRSHASAGSRTAVQQGSREHAAHQTSPPLPPAGACSPHLSGSWTCSPQAYSQGMCAAAAPDDVTGQPRAEMQLWRWQHAVALGCLWCLVLRLQHCKQPALRSKQLVMSQHTRTQGPHSSCCLRESSTDVNTTRPPAPQSPTQLAGGGAAQLQHDNRLVVLDRN